MQICRHYCESYPFVNGKINYHTHYRCVICLSGYPKSFGVNICECCGSHLRSNCRTRNRKRRPPTIRKRAAGGKLAIAETRRWAMEMFA